tara:strand:+ start:382 stop:1599 length:1218 start_codon:yes stop_codon:yes gene_type:complete
MDNGIFDVETMIALERQKHAQNAQDSVPVSAAGLLQGINFGGQSPMGSGAVSAPPPMMTPQPPIPPSPPAEKPGFFSRLGTSLKDPTTLAGLSAAFNQMTLNPDAQLQKRASDMMAIRSATKQANKTVEYLRAQNRNDLADLVESNPSMAAEVLKGLATSKAGGFMRKTVGGVQTDQETGQMFTVEQNPNNGTITRTDIPGAFGPTEAEKNTALLDQTKAEFDTSQGLKKGEEVFNQFNLIDKQIQDFRRIGELVDEGAKTGFVEKFLWSTDASTTELRQIANKMGIDIINSATFGALSATELRLALSTGFDQNLKGDQLVDYIQRKISAQTKLRNALMPEVQMLLGGSGLKQYADYKINNRKRHDAADKSFSKLQKIISDLTKAEWETFNLEERESIMKGEGLL